MILKIPANKAIEILKKRKSEIYQIGFQSKVWKGKTENDLQEIFGAIDNKKFQINNIRFETPVTSLKYEILEKGKKEADQFLESYIEQIEEYSSIQNDSIPENESTLQNENSILKDDNNSLLTKIKETEHMNSLLSNQIKSKDQEIIRLEQNTVQLTDISIKKVLKLISHLPVNEVISIGTVIIAILGFSFWLGSTVQENGNKSQEYNFNKEIDSKNDSLKFLKTNIKSKELENLKLKKELDSIKVVLQKK